MLLILAPEILLQLFFPLVAREYSKNNKKLIGDLSKQVEKWILIIPTSFFLFLKYHFYNRLIYMETKWNEEWSLIGLNWIEETNDVTKKIYDEYLLIKNLSVLVSLSGQ